MSSQRLRMIVVPFWVALLCSGGHAQDHLSGTTALDWPGDLASKMVAGVDRFLLRKLDESITTRPRYWQRDFSSREKYVASVDPNRQRFAHILGVRDDRLEMKSLDLVATIARAAEVGRGKNYRVLRVRWQVFEGLHGEGLLLEPTNQAVAHIVAIPDAEQTPESLAGLEPGCESQFARRLAENGCRVVIPALVSRQVHQRGRAELTDREFIYRSAFELGRHLLGYEIQKVLAVIDWFEHSTKDQPNAEVGIIGWGEGGLLALYASALDTRIDATCVSGYFGPREGIWQQPIDRNVFGLLEQFGDAEVASLIAPRKLVIEPAKGPEADVRTNGGAPYRLTTPVPSDVKKEARRAEKLVEPLAWKIDLVATPSDAAVLSTDTLARFVKALSAGLDDVGADRLPTIDHGDVDGSRQARIVRELDRYNQRLLTESPYVRSKFFARLDTSSVQTHQETVEWYRDYFRQQVIGHFEDPLLAPNPRTRKVYDQPKWQGYQVVLDVFPDVFAFGVLLLPKDLRPGDRRPVVVCQHGLEGRPRDTIEGDQGAYHDFAAKLAERGFITFAPQNLYIFRDRFRTLQRKANPLGKTLFSVMVPQHQQITAWLASLPQVDPERIAFYGLSYGGKSAMRIPPLVDRYCLSICSADFNDWVWKNASSRSPYSYVGTGEYEIFEFDLGSTFNYSEMAALIAPRPFMVERGHFDGVAPDERVAYEFAKVRNLYQAQLGIGDHCEIEWFVGPHTIHGQGTFDFLHRHLHWPKLE